jgi:flagellar protein FliJ
VNGFHFRLESVLSLRKRREEALQRDLADALRALDMEVEECDRLEREMKDRARTSARERRPGPVDVVLLSLEGGYLDLLQRRLVAQKSRVEQQEQIVSEVREGLLKASREKKALETYREKVLSSFARDEAHKEQNRAEEAAGVLYLLRQEFGSPRGLAGQ